MAVIHPTPEQARVLDAAGAHVAVAAGAGSGKTTLLVERIWRDLTVDGLHLGDLFVATYNRVAAAHLVTRIQARFADPQAGLPPGRACLDVSAGWIGTFHSLCARIAREHPFAAGVDPLFGELDDAEGAVMQEGALDLAMAGVDHPGLNLMLSHAGSTATIRSAVLAVFGRLRAAGVEHPVIRVPDAVGPDADDLARLADLVDRIAGHPDRADRHVAGIDAVRVMLRAGVPTLSPPSIHGTAKAGIKPLIQDANALALHVWSSLVGVESRPQLEGFAALLDAFGHHYARLKAQQGALDYDDLQLAALRVLEAPHPYRFARVYVDEFQDANAVQDRIIHALRAQRVTVVGDGAQAIYGFRHASAEHFTQHLGPAPGLTLRDNHRSQPQLMHALNGLLAGVMRNQPQFAPLTPCAPPDAGAPPMLDPPVEIITVVSAEGDATRVQEGRVLAGRVRGFLEMGYQPREVVVLFRALTMVEPYRAALAGEGIPVHLVAGSGFFTHDQVADVLALLAVVRNLHDEPALIRVLAGPHIGASDTDLLALRAAAPRGAPLWPAVGLVPGTAPLVAVRDGLVPVLREAGLPALVEAAAGAGGYDLAVLGYPDGPRRHANMRRLVRMAERFSAVRGPDLGGFLAAMGTLAADPRLDPGEAALVDPELNAVRLATIHSVKGQQFPVVIVADATHGTPGQHPAVLVGPDGLAGLRAQRAGGPNADVLGYADLSAAAARAAADEERRVLYVALTRAMRHAAIIGRSARRDGGANTMYRLAAEAAGTGLSGVAVTRREVPVIEVPQRVPMPIPPPVTPVPAPIIPEAPATDPLRGRRLSFTAISAFATCPRRFHLQFELGLPAGRGVVPAGGGDPFGTQVGTLVHHALAAHRWGAPGPPPGWAAPLAGSLNLTLPMDDLLRAERLVAAVVADQIAARIARAALVRTEQPFAFDLDGVMISGAIDLLADERDGSVLLVDWKTHRLGDRTAAQVMAGYRLQQAVYGLAALESGAKRVELRWVFPEALDAPQSRLVGAAQVDGLRGEVRDALGALAAGGRQPAACAPMDYCGGCPGLDAFCPVSAA